MNDTRSNLIKAGHLALGVAEVRPLDHACEPAAANAVRDEPAAPAPKVALIRDGDIVRAIEVTCPCGNTMVIECDYGEENGS